MKFGIQPADFYMSNDDMDIMPKKFKMKIVKLAKLIETCSKAPDVEIFLLALFEACFEFTGVKVKPTMIQFDRAGQLKTGIIAGTRGYGKVSTQIQFSNAFCVIFLRMADIMEKEITEIGN